MHNEQGVVNAKTRPLTKGRAGNPDSGGNLPHAFPARLGTPGNSPGMIFKHYRELVRPEEAKKWFAIVPA